MRLWSFFWLVIALSAGGVPQGFPANPPEPAEIDQIIRDFGNQNYATREAAGQRLLRLAEGNYETVLTQSLQTYRQITDPEVKWRLKSVMAKVVDQYLFRVPRGFLGVRPNQVIIGVGGKLIMNGVTIPPGAVWISQVIDETPAQKAGLLPNDFILALDGQPCAGGTEGFVESVQSRRPGDRLRLSVLRGEATNEVETVLGELPEDLRALVYTPERSRAFFARWFKEKLNPTPESRPAKPTP